MDRFSLRKQLFAEFLIMLIVFGSCGALFIPYRVQAGTPVFETNPILTIHDTQDTAKEWALDAVAWAIGGTILQALASQTLNWVTNGQTPSFVKDWQGFLISAGSLAYSQFATNYFLPTILPNIDSSYRSLLQAYVQSPFNPLDVDLKRITQSTLQNYGINRALLSAYPRDFQAGGGWRTLEALSEPNNNFYTAYLETINAQARTIAGAVTGNQQRALAGQGFLGQLDPLNWQTKTPGKTVGDVVQKNVADSLPDRLQNADEIAEILVSILSAGFNRLLTQGLQ